jgi:hypothetical protein
MVRLNYSCKDHGKVMTLLQMCALICVILTTCLVILYSYSRFIWKHSDTYTSVTRGLFLNNIYILILRAYELNVIPVSTSIQDFKTHGNTLHQYLCKETIGDEYHFLLVCKNENIITLRNKYLPNYYRVYPNHAKLFISRMNIGLICK